MSPIAVAIRHNYSNTGDGTHPHHKILHTAFYWGTEAEIMFPGWPGKSPGMYALALVFVFTLAVLVEGLSHCTVVKPGSNRVAGGFFQTGIFAVRAGLAYMVMLAVMSYNAGVFLVAVAGHAVGFAVFRSFGFRRGSDS
ncbi:hypothetical protein RJ640_023477 [Escallonia rubra]|uniref:Copper transport protein n=1 Tax=Escallonia rubra TaxID=112253 RepID=A0AA88RU44_9ASTE|nr:hypothetical protein RJ640_006926 [Escallonia rubra]KAK2989906.1 hypothetical protein RJ640_019489 [Escallonia rubra]KAK2992094.1 hypothetical protein RJ640_023477 [Escallonia rubra]